MKYKVRGTSMKHVERILILLLLVAAGCLIFLPEHIAGLLTIVADKDVLLTDYIAVGGLGPALLNAVIVTSIALWTVIKNDVPMNGYAYAGLFTMMGFAFFGKSVYNILPIYLGVYLFSKFMRVPFKQYAIMAMFACGLAPFSTIAMDFGFIGIIGGAMLATFLGFIVCAVASYAMKFHNGYLLYNFGFAGGVLAILVTSILRTFDFEIESVLIVNEDQLIHYILVALLIIISLYLLIAGILYAKFDWQEYKKLLHMSGRSITDYYHLFGENLMLINMGLVGFILLTFALLLKVPLNGPTFGAILSGIGFAAFGKNPKNILPVMLGSVTMLFLTQTPASAATVITVIFVTGLAPIAGEFGFIVGLLTGMIHFSLTQYTALWQGGGNLYNNGFAAGFVAGVVASVMENVKEIKNRK